MMSRVFLTDHILCDLERASQLQDEQLPGVLLALLETLATVLARVLERGIDHLLETPGSVPPSRRMLTREQVADELNIKPDAVSLLIRHYSLPAHRMGRFLRVSRADLDRYKRQNSTLDEGGRR